MVAVSPQSHGPEQTLFIGDDLDIRTVFQGDFFRVATPDVERVPIKGCGGLRDRPFQDLVPAFRAVLQQAALAELAFIGFLAPRMVA